MRLRGRFGLLFVILLLGASVAKGQWSVVQQFPSGVTTVYFLDKATVPTEGFVGLQNGDLWKTTDRGLTWRFIATFGAKVSSIAFVDANTGWCATLLRMFKTTNGGVSWSDAGVGYTSVFSVAVDSITHNVCAVEQYAVMVSTNLGASWTTIDKTYHVSVDFCGLNGAVPGVGTFTTSLNTTDGGVTWDTAKSGPVNECWSIAAVTPTDFFAVSELSNTVHHSTDSGVSWNTICTLANVKPTGCIRGTLSCLFVQTATANKFLVSTNEGYTWSAPNPCTIPNGADSRFYSMGKEVWAGDWTGNLWYSPDPTYVPKLQLTITPVKLRLAATRCIGRDTLLPVHYAGACDATLAAITSLSPGFSVSPKIRHSSTAGFDTVEILYSPGPTLNDTGSFLLEFEMCCQYFDTILNVSGTGAPSTPVFAMPDSLYFRPFPACSSRDSVFIFKNYSCDTLIISNGIFGDSMHYKLGTKLPVNVAPKDSVKIHVDVSSGVAGNYLDTLRMHLIYTYGIEFDTSVTFSASTFQNSHVLFPSLSMTIDGDCHVVDTSVTIDNLLCDSVIFTLISLADSTYFQVSPPVLPYIVGPGAPLRIPVTISPKSFTGETVALHLRYIQGGASHDTVITLSELTTKETPSISFDKSGLDFGPVAEPCNDTARYLSFGNPHCDSIRILAIQALLPDTIFTIDHVTLPFAIAPSGKDSALVRFKPAHKGNWSAQVRITYELDGTRRDTLISIFGSGSTPLPDTLLNALLAFDTVRTCQTKMLDARLVNNGCTPIIVTNGLLSGGEGFESLAPRFPDTLGAYDTLDFQLQFVPVKLGVSQDSLVVLLQSTEDGAQHSRTILLNGFSLPAAKALSLPTSLRVTNLPPCVDSWDTSIWIYNQSVCDSLIVTKGFVTGDSALTLDANNHFPITLGQSDSVQIFIHALPLSLSQQSTVHLQGPGLDTTIIITYQSLAGGGGSWALSTDKADYVVKACQTEQRVCAIVGGGCDSMIISSVELSNLLGDPAGSRFTLRDTMLFPQMVRSGDTMFFHILYDPSQPGDDTVILRASSASTVYSTELIGRSIPISSATIALTAADGSLVCSNDPGKTVQLAIMSLNEIPDSLSLRMISCKLHYNGTLLTAGTPAGQAGWSVSANEEAPGIADIVLKSSGGAVTPGSILAMLTFGVTVGDSSGSDIGMTQLRFNGNDPTYETCVLSSSSISTGVRFTLMDDCLSPIIRTYLDEQPITLSVQSDASVGASHFMLKLPGAMHISLAIFNELGEAVRTMQSDPATAGAYEMYWDGRDALGADVPSAIYYYRLVADGRMFSGGIGVVR